MAISSNKSERIFVPVDLEDKRAEIWDQLSQQKLSILARDEQGTCFYLKLNSRKRDLLVCSFVATEPYLALPVLKSSQTLTLLFQLGLDKYVLQGKITEAENLEIKVQALVPMHRVQRRKDFRISLAEFSPKSFIQIGTVKFDVLDISAGGCKIDLLEADQFKVQAVKTGALHLVGETYQPIAFEARHSKMQPTTKRTQVGLMFQFIDASLEFKLLQAVFALEKQMAGRKN